MPEFALAALSFLALLLAAADFSFTLFSRVVLRHAVREGMRFAITGQTLDGMAHDASIREVVRSNSFGLLDSGTPISEKVLINYYGADGVTLSASNGPGHFAHISLQSHWQTPIGAVLRSNHPIPVVLDAVDVVEPYGFPPPAR